MSNKLLEEAKRRGMKRDTRPRWNDMTFDQLELAIAYLKGDINQTQFTETLGLTGGNPYGSMGSMLRQAVKKGMIKEIILNR